MALTFVYLRASAAALTEEGNDDNGYTTIVMPKISSIILAKIFEAYTFSVPRTVM